MKKKMLLFGGSGLLGSRIKILPSNFDIYTPPRTEVDVTERKSIEKIVNKISADVIVYAAGITNQDFAEHNRDITLLVNKEAVTWVASIAAKKKIQLIYFSTDAVFTGNQKNRPYTETDVPSPVNFYGQSKLAGEKAVLAASENNLVLRLISLYTGFPHHKTDFARIIVKDLLHGKNCVGIIDQFFNPGFIDNIVFCLNMLINKKINGVLHLGSADYLTNYEFAQRIAEKINVDVKLVNKITVKKFFDNRAAGRGKYPWLDISRAQGILGPGVLNTNKQNINLFYKQILDYNSNINV